MNQASAAGGSGTVACQNLMFATKQSLIGAGAWTDSTGAGAAPAGNFAVRSSCSGAGGAGSFGNGDGVDHWAATTDCRWGAAGANHSWTVLRQTGLGPTCEVCIDLIPGVASARISMSMAGFNLDGTATNRPTAPDEAILRNSLDWGGVNAATASTLHVMNSIDGKSTRVLICRNGFVCGFWAFEQLSETSPSWTTPVMCTVLGDQTGAPIVSQNVFGSYSNVPNVEGLVSGFVYQAYLMCEGVPTGVIGTLQTVANDMGASWPILDQGVYSLVPNSRGWLGKVVDMYWTSTALADSDTFPAAGTRNFLVGGDMVLPWNTTAPVFGGGASTARDGEWIQTDAFASSLYLNPVMGGPDAVTTSTGAVQYLMEAWDSVTGIQYVWLRPTRDFSGAGYPGPNAPTNIAVAAEVPA